MTDSSFIGPLLTFDPEDWGRPVNHYAKTEKNLLSAREATIKFSSETMTKSAEKLIPTVEKVAVKEGSFSLKTLGSVKGLIGKVTPWDVAKGAGRFAAINLLFPGSFWQNAAASVGFEATRIGLKNRGYGGVRSWVAAAAVSAGVNALIGAAKPKDSVYPSQSFASRFSGKDDAYNTITGLRDQGMAQDIRHSLTQFGSGYDSSRPLPTSLMGVPIDPRILKFRQEVIDNPEERAELEARLKEKASAAQANLGDFTEEDYTSTNLGVIEGLNLQNKNLQAINLSKFAIEADDADTLTLRRKGLAGLFGDPIQVRLSGVDAPETAGHANDPMEEVRIWQGQAGGKWSTEAFQKLLAEQKNLSLVIDTQNKTYGRSLGTLVGDDNKNINLELIRSGIVSALPFGKTETDVISRSEAARAEKQAVSQDAGIWGLSRYRAIKQATDALGNPITYNTLTEINKLSQNLTLGAYGSFLQSLGAQQRELTPEETAISRRFGYTLRKSHGQPRFQQRWSGRDDNYNTIEGLRHGGLAEQTRHQLTDFGSGSQIAIKMAQEVSKTGKLFSGIAGVIKQLGLRFGVNKKELAGYTGGMVHGIFSPKAISSSISDLTTAAGVSINRTEASFMSHGIGLHEISEVATARNLGLDKKFANVSVLDSLMNPSMGQNFGSHLSRQVVEDEAFLSYHLGDEAFRSMRKLRGIEGTSVVKQIEAAEQQTNLIEGFVKTKDINRLKEHVSSFIGEVPEKYREQANQEFLAAIEKPGFFKDLEKGIKEQRKEIGKQKNKHYSYIKEVNKIYKETPSQAEKQFKQYGITRMNVSAEEVRQQLPYIEQATTSFPERLTKSFNPISGKDDAYNTIEGLRHGGMEEGVRKNLTEFGSGWDKAIEIAERLMSKGILKRSENKLASLLEHGPFIEALRSGKRIKQLGKEGGFGAAFLHEVEFHGERFQYVIKELPEGRADWLRKNLPNAEYTIARSHGSYLNEFNAYRNINGEIMPSAYRHEPGRLFMEYMPGETIEQIRARGGHVPQDLINKAINKQMEVVAAKGYVNRDINPGNILVDSETGRVSWIDFGVAEKGWHGETALQKMKEELNFFNQFFINREVVPVIDKGWVQKEISNAPILPGESLFANTAANPIPSRKPIGGSIEGLHPGGSGLGAKNLKDNAPWGSIINLQKLGVLVRNLIRGDGKTIASTLTNKNWQYSTAESFLASQQRIWKEAQKNRWIQLRKNWIAGSSLTDGTRRLRPEDLVGENEFLKVVRERQKEVLGRAKTIKEDPIGRQLIFDEEAKVLKEKQANKQNYLFTKMKWKPYQFKDPVTLGRFSDEDAPLLKRLRAHRELAENPGKDLSPGEINNQRAIARLERKKYLAERQIPDLKEPNLGYTFNMKNFNKISTDAVGVGHRAAHNAGRKHSRFSSINSA